LPAFALVIFGALFTLAAAYSLGRAAVWKWNASASVTLAIGAALLSTLIFFLRLAGYAWPRYMFTLGIACLAPLPWLGMGTFGRWKPHRSFTIILALYGLYYAVHSLAPEIQADPNVYHLTPAVDALHTGGFPEEISFYERLPQGMEDLFAMAYAFGGSSSAKLVHFAFLLLSIPLLIQLGRRFQIPDELSAIATAIYFVTPVAGVSGTAAFNDAALTAFSIAAILLVLDETAPPVLTGIIAGFCYAIKPTGGLVVLLCAAYLLKQRNWRALLWFCAGSVAMVAPWLVRNALEIGNPFAPLANRFFPNPYFHISSEQYYTSYLRNYGNVPWREFPYQLCIAGEKLQGLLGPLFLLAPVALFALRRRCGRIALGLALFLSIPWLLNAGTRFLMPGIPFLALAMILAVPRPAAYALLLVHAVTCAPPLVELYAPNAWRLRGFPIRAALRMESEPGYLQRVSWDYRVAKMIEDHTAPGDRILDLYGAHRAFIDRIVITSYQSALGDTFAASLDAASYVDHGALYDQKALFPEQPIIAVRIRNTLSAPRTWTIADIELFRQGAKLAAGRRWALDAWPNVWDAPLAFDQNVTSRWSTWEQVRAGMFFEVEFDCPQTLTAINVISPGEDRRLSTQIYIQHPDETWTELTPAWTARPSINLRKAATHYIRRSGIHYIVAIVSNQGAGMLGKMLADQPGDWGLERVANEDNVYLLRIL
jgi:hypothetical protein